MLINGYGATWNLWNIGALSPSFADARVITSGAESASLGYDPLIENPRDPWGRKLNYPRIWQTLSGVGINQSHTVYFGIALAALFVTGIFLFTPHTISGITAFILIVSIFSPAVLLGVERGNIDLLMFFLLSAAIFYMRRELLTSKVIAAISLLLAIVLKLFPVFGLGLVLSERKNIAVKTGILLLGVAGIYALATYNDLVLIHKATPKSGQYSYGIDVLWMNVSRDDPMMRKILRVSSYFLASVSFVGALYWIYVKRAFGDLENVDGDRRSIDAFRVGSGIYIGTFLLGNNWDYRLMFLLFVIPQLSLWAKSLSKVVSLTSRFAIACTLISFWHLVVNQRMFGLFWGSKFGLLIDQFSNWTVFLTLLLLYFYSLPAWTEQHRLVQTSTLAAKKSEPVQAGM